MITRANFATSFYPFSDRYTPLTHDRSSNQYYSQSNVNADARLYTGSIVSWCKFPSYQLCTNRISWTQWTETTQLSHEVTPINSAPKKINSGKVDTFCSSGINYLMHVSTQVINMSLFDYHEVYKLFI